MATYRVLPSKEWFTLDKVFVGGEVVELSENEALPFLGNVFAAEVAPVPPAAEVADDKPKAKRSK